jgi:uncharacterized membrane protein
VKSEVVIVFSITVVVVAVAAERFSQLSVANRMRGDADADDQSGREHSL